MDYAGNAMKTIRERRSWRSYDGRPLSAADRDRLTAYLAGLSEGPFGNAVRVCLIVAAGDDYKDLLKDLGTYGVVSGARSFLVGAVRPGPMDMEDFGFVFEAAVLTATAMGLGTCWLGATFNRTGFGRAIAAANGEVMPAVSPVGYVARRRTLTDATTRYLARAASRKPWAELFFLGEWGKPLAPEGAGPYRDVLESVRLGPSASNRQPWRLIQDAGGIFHLYLKRTPLYNSKALNVPGGDLQRLDMGIAMCHFAAGALEAGLAGAWMVSEPIPATVLPDRVSYVASWRPRRSGTP